MKDNLKERAEGASRAISEEVTKRAWEAKNHSAATSAPVPSTPTTATFNNAAPKEPNLLVKWVTKIADKLDRFLSAEGPE